MFFSQILSDIEFFDKKKNAVKRIFWVRAGLRGFQRKDYEVQIISKN